MIRPDGLLKACELQGLNAVAITDHDTIDGVEEVRRWFAKRGSRIEVLPGEERTLRNGCHVIALLLREALAGDTWEEVSAEAHEQGALVLAPHPFRAKDGLLGPRGVPWKQLQGVDGLEIHNAKGSYEDNQRARDFGKGLATPGFGGSDAHYEADVGLCVNEVEWSGGGAEGAVRAMFAGQTPFRVLARRQQAGQGERRYAPAYYTVRRWVRLPRAALPLAKASYRLYWNWRRGGQRHELAEVWRQAGD